MPEIFIRASSTTLQILAKAVNYQDTFGHRYTTGLRVGVERFKANMFIWGLAQSSACELVRQVEAQVGVTSNHLSS